MYRTSDTQMSDCSHNMDVAIDTPLFFGSLVILRDLSHGRTIVLTVGLLYTQKKEAMAINQ